MALLEGREDEAGEQFEAALELLEAALGEGHALVSYPLHGLARLRAARGESVEAEGLFRRCLEIREATLGEDRSLLAETRRDYAELLRQIGRREDAALHERSAAALVARP